MSSLTNGTANARGLCALQVSTEAPGDASYFRYDEGHFDTALQAVFMEYSGIELKDKWCRFWYAKERLASADVISCRLSSCLSVQGQHGNC